MNNVRVKGEVNSSVNRDMKLNNGDLLLWCDKNGEILNTYLVVSFRKRGQDSNCYATTGMCSLINLDKGTLEFDEPCSRTTTEYRVLAHLNRTGGQACSPYTNIPKEKIRQFRNGDYHIEIELLKEEF